MNELAIAIFGVLAVFVVLQTLYALAFVSSFCLPSSKTIKDELLPKAAVILSLRGADPFLTDCVHALLHQNYPQYNLHIVVDSQQDPAWNIVNKTIQQVGATHVQISTLIARHNTCSLKGSALVQAIHALDDSYKVVAFIDADVIAHPNWLRELVAPLMDERIGATTGNRWYMPQIGQWGSLVRYLWNTVAVIFMCIHQAPSFKGRDFVFGNFLTISADLKILKQPNHVKHLRIFSTIFEILKTLPLKAKPLGEAQWQ
jgi:cellulose synthase/poly-beta-1,6-N-acetylglucosamine synthase-like glycosyltransferase